MNTTKKNNSRMLHISIASAVLFCMGFATFGFANAMQKQDVEREIFEHKQEIQVRASTLTEVKNLADSRGYEYVEDGVSAGKLVRVHNKINPINETK